jgi:type II secretory pathway pseudopilin PulG
MSNNKHFLKAKKENGFSTIELLVVSLIILLTATFSFMPLKNTWESYRLESAARLLASDIRLMQQYCFRNKEAAVTIVFYSFGYEKFYMQDNRIKKKEMVVLPSSTKIVVNKLMFGSGENILRFNTKGTPIPGGGTVHFQNSRGEHRYVIVTPATGRVRVSKFPPLS